MKKDYDSTRIYRNTQKKGASQTYDTPSFLLEQEEGENKDFNLLKQFFQLRKKTSIPR